MNIHTTQTETVREFYDSAIAIGEHHDGRVCLVKSNAWHLWIEPGEDGELWIGDENDTPAADMSGCGVVAEVADWLAAVGEDVPSEIYSLPVVVR